MDTAAIEHLQRLGISKKFLGNFWGLYLEGKVDSTFINNLPLPQLFPACIHKLMVAELKYYKRLINQLLPIPNVPTLDYQCVY